MIIFKKCNIFLERMRDYKLIPVLLLFFTNLVFSQEYKFIGDHNSQTVSFKFINNIIIIPLEVNGNSLNFILDTGVSSPVIFNLKSSDSIRLNQLKKIKLRGLGDGDSVDALQSKNNRIRFDKIVGTNRIIYLIYNEKLDLSSKLGIPVNGIIGYDLFKDFIVTINYKSKRLTFTKPDCFKYKSCNKCEEFDLFFFKKKPYIQGEIVVGAIEQKTIPVQLLIDSGGTDSLWLFEDDEKGIIAPDDAFDDFIGEGISGGIYGKRSRIESFRLKKFEIERPNVAYLDSISTKYAKSLRSRNGSLGGNVLRRFHIIMDYPNKKITLKKNNDFKDDFHYNMSGIELVHAGKTLVKEVQQNSFSMSDSQNKSSTSRVVFDYSYNYVLKPIFKIDYVRQNSPAEKVGIQVGDLLLELNEKPAHNYTIEQIVSFFYEENKEIKISVERLGLVYNFQFKTKNALKK